MRDYIKNVNVGGGSEGLWAKFVLITHLLFIKDLYPK